MAKPGTGWIPDYPDVRDYKLTSSEVQSLAAKVQSKEETSSLEMLAQKVSEALNVLEKQPGVTPQDREKLQHATREIEEKIVGEVTFCPVRVHKVLRVGMADPEVTLIKYYLDKIVKKYNWVFGADYKPLFTDSTLDSETKDQIEAFQNSQHRTLLSDGMVDINTMEALRILADDIDQGWVQSPWADEVCQKWRDVFQKIPKITEEKEFRPSIHLLLIDIEKSLRGNITAPIISGNYDNLGVNLNELEADEKRNIFETKVAESLELSRQKISILNNILDKEIQELSNSEDNQKNIDNLLFIVYPRFFPKQSEQLETLKEVISEYDAKTISGFSIDPPNTISSAENSKFSLWLNKFSLCLEEIKKNSKEYGFLQFPPGYFDRLEIPLPSPVPDLVDRVIRQKLSDSMNDVHEWMRESIHPLVDALRQTLMPLGQYGNMEEALERQFERLRSLGLGGQKASLDTPKASDSNAMKLKQFIQEAIKELNLPTDSSGAFENTYSGFDFQELIFSAILEIEESIPEPKTDSSHDFRYRHNSNLHRIINQYVVNSSAYQHFKASARREKSKPKRELFEIELDRVPKPTQKACEGLQDYVQFPIHRSLSEAIRQQTRDESPTVSREESDTLLTYAKTRENKNTYLSLPEFVDLSYWCSAIEDQGLINSCTAHAGIALTEYFEKKSFGKYTDASRLFLYKVARNLMQREGDSGTSVRETMKAMVSFGICPEAYWPYEPEQFDQEPTPFCYSFAQNYQALKYFRLDYAGISKYILLAQIKVMLATEFPCMFGFTLYSSVLDETNRKRGHIPYPTDADKIEGGHAVVAVGYHDRKVVKNADGKESVGALLIRNSWGPQWGQGGYGWLPYEYVLDGLTADWWSLLKSEWLQSGKFGGSTGSSTNDMGKGGGKGGCGEHHCWCGQHLDTKQPL